MKKFLLSSLFLCLSQKAFSADYIVMLWTQDSGYTVNQVVDVPWSGKEISFSPPAPQGRAVKSNVTCSVQKIMGSWYGHTSWIAVPEKIQIAGENVPIEVDATSSWYKHFSAGGYSYWYHVDDWNHKHDDTLSSDCGAVGDIKIYPIDVKYDGLKLKFIVPRGLPTGATAVSLIMGGGEEAQYWSASNQSMNLPQSFIQNGIKNLRYNFTFNVQNSCNAGSLNYVIDYGNLTPSDAQHAEKTIRIPVECTGPTGVEFKLIPTVAGSENYDGKPSVGLGNGWDALIKLNGKSAFSDNMQWNSAGSKNIEITSNLQNVNGVPGKFEGSLTLVIQPL